MKKLLTIFCIAGLLAGCTSTQTKTIANSDPVLSPYPQPFLFLGDRDPTDSETDPPVYHGLDGLLLMWRNTSTNELWYQLDNTATPQMWQKFMTSANISNYAPSLPTPNRDYSFISLAFNTARTPSPTHDVQVLRTDHITANTSQSSTIAIQIDCGSGFTEKLRTSTTLGVLIDQDINFSFIVPANCAYKVVDSGTGTNTTVNNQELTI